MLSRQTVDTLQAERHRLETLLDAIDVLLEGLVSGPTERSERESGVLDTGGGQGAPSEGEAPDAPAAARAPEPAAASERSRRAGDLPGKRSAKSPAQDQASDPLQLPRPQLPRKLTAQMERFLEHVDDHGDPNGCWSWKGGKNGGYTFYWPLKMTAHRAGIQLLRRVDMDKTVKTPRLCDAHQCVNPWHYGIERPQQ